MLEDSKTEAKHVLSSAERQARYRACQVEEAGLNTGHRRPTERRTRPQR